MEIPFKDPTDWIQALATIAAVVLSVIAIIRSAKTEKLSKKIGLSVEKLSSLRSMVHQIEQVKINNLASPNDDNNKRARIVASKTQSYEALFATYQHCLPPADVTRLKGLIQEIHDQSKAALAASQSGNMNESFNKYVSSMAELVIVMETMPHKELEKTSKELEVLSS